MKLSNLQKSGGNLRSLLQTAVPVAFTLIEATILRQLLSFLMIL